MDVAAWLLGLGLGQYADAFAEHDIDAATLGRLTAPDLKEIGVASVGHRRRLLDAIARLDGQAVAPMSDVAEATSEAERRQLTVMFCDLVGSTALAEGLDPEDLREIIRSYQDQVSTEVGHFEGNVAKFMGDGVLAYFGWPQAHEDDAERAVRSGLAIADAIGHTATPTEQPLAVRVGIATGVVVVGDLVGEGGAQEEAVVGSTPNLAARLQGLAEGNAVVIADSTRALLGERFAYKDLGLRELHGFSEPMQTWQVIRPIEAESRFEVIRGPHLTPLIGRKEELALLMRRWATAKAGKGQVVLLTGEPGIGKSRIAYSLREQVAQDPHVQLFYQCSPYHTNSALHPFIRQLERTADFARENTNKQKLRKLTDLLAQSNSQARQATALLAALLSLPKDDRCPPPAMSPQRQKEETLGVLLEQLEGLAAKQAVLVILEDAHWVDPTSQELLDLIVERVKALPVLVLITFRPEYQSPWSGQAHVTLHTLNRLNADLGAALVRELSGKDLPQEILEQIVVKTDGIPLFVEELTKTVLNSGLLAVEQDRYILAGDLPQHAIPTSLKDSLMARLDQLAPVKEVAQIGAVIGREFSYEILAAVATLPSEELDKALERLHASELIFRRGVPPDTRYLFKHALVQDAAYESLLKGRRQQLHARIARVIEEQFPERTAVEPELVAHHCTEAGLVEQAVTYWRRAGERAVAQSAHVEATEHLERALALLGQLPSTTDRLREELAIQTALGPTLMVTKGWAAPAVGAAYTRALELCRQLGEEAELFPILRGLWEFHEAQGDYQRARPLAEQLLKLAKQADSRALSISAHDAMADTLFWLGEFTHSHSQANQGLALYDTKQHDELAYRYGAYSPGVACLCFSGWGLWFLGYPEQALLRSQEALRRARDLSQPVSLVVALTWFAMLHHYRREAPEAQALAEEAMAISAKQSFSNWFAAAAMVNGWALAEQGRNEEGRDQLRESVALADTAGTLIWRPYQLSLLAEVHGKTGKSQEAQRLQTEALGIAERTGERYWEAELHRLSGELLRQHARNDPAGAEDSFKRAIDTAQAQGAKSLELRAATSLSRLWQQQGKRREARDLLAPLYEWFTEGFDTADLKEAKALLETLH